MDKPREQVVEIVGDQAEAWYRVPNSVVREVGQLDGYSARSRMTLDHSYFAEGADFERFNRAAEASGVDLIQVHGGTEDVSRVRYFGQYRADLVANPLKPGDEIRLKDGTAATIAGMDRDRLTDQPVVVVEQPGADGPQRRFFPSTMVAQAVMPSHRLDLQLERDRGYQAPEPGRKPAGP